MTPLILHIPHASVTIPETQGYVVGRETLEREMLKLTDWYTDDLFSRADEVVIQADFSRIFCDVERFADDRQEVMAQYGMGVLYEKTDLGDPLRKVRPALRTEILNRYYWPHHNALNRAVEQQLEAQGKALIVDCHSFPSTPFRRDLDQTPNRPDFNIGIDDFHTPAELIACSKSFFQDRGYSLGINWPYSGSIVPLTHYNTSENVKSIMLEVNRALYLREPANEKSSNYQAVKETISAYLDAIKAAWEDV